MAASPYTVGYGPRVEAQHHTARIDAFPRLQRSRGGQELAAAVLFLVLQLTLIGIFSALLTTAPGPLP
jgi:hypothetical protein